jgi:hypothetical protein
MFEKAVMRGTKTLAGVPGDDWTTAMRLADCCAVRPAACTCENGVARAVKRSPKLKTYLFMQLP